MKVGNPKLILDPYDWLPSDGESSISFRSNLDDVIIEIVYENKITALDIDNEDVLLSKRELTFKRVAYFIKGKIPGTNFFEYDEKSLNFVIGTLTEFLYSEFAKNSMEIYYRVSNHAAPDMRHFSIQFMSANINFDILAEEVYLSEELPIT